MRNLEPEYLSWSADDSTLFVNLQENNAVAIIDAARLGRDARRHHAPSRASVA